MTVKEVNAEIISIISEAIQPNFEITLDTHLVKELGLTSVETMMLVSDLEDRFSVDVPGKLLRNVWTVQDLCNVIISCLA